MASSRSGVLKLYKSMMREAFQFQSYNFRMYAVRRIRDGFRASKKVDNQKDLDTLLKYATDNLEVMKRQTVIGKLYAGEKLIIEQCGPKDFKIK